MDGSAQDPIDRLRQMIEEADSVVAFTGAGISTESGIPDFRSPGGIWTRYRPIDFRDFVASEEMRIESWRRRFATDDVMRQAQPNLGHRALAELARRGKLSCVITQNVDGLHQASGLAAGQVIELHGNGTFAKCLDCGKRHELEPIRRHFEAEGRPPPCSACNGVLKTATISFGQAMPEEEMRRAQVETQACQLFLVIGSSLVVYPAAGLPLLAKRSGAGLVILNREATEQDEIADLVLNREIGPTLGAVVRVN